MTEHILRPRVYVIAFIYFKQFVHTAQIENCFLPDTINLSGQLLRHVTINIYIFSRIQNILFVKKKIIKQKELIKSIMAAFENWSVHNYVRVLYSNTNTHIYTQGKTTWTKEGFSVICMRRTRVCVWHALYVQRSSRISFQRFSSVTSILIHMGFCLTHPQDVFCPTSRRRRTTSSSSNISSI
jgi:hypothetical protein